MYELTVWIDPDGPLKSGVQYSNGSGNLMITGCSGAIEDIRFVLREDQQELWRLSEFSYKVAMGPDVIGGKPVIKLVSVANEAIQLEDRLGEFGRYKYTIQIRAKNNGELYTSDPELQNVREVGPTS